MASPATIEGLIALTVAHASAELILTQVMRSGASIQIMRQARAVTSAVQAVRDKWPPLIGREKDVFVRRLEPVVTALRETGGLPGHVLTYLAWLFVGHSIDGLWEHNSPKGGAMDSVLRQVEDLHWLMRGELPEHYEQARAIFEAWKRFEPAPVAAPMWRRT